MKPRLCCIEPSGAFRLVLIEIARKAGWDIEACKSLAEAEEIFALQDKQIDLVVTAATLETGGYTDVIKSLRSRPQTSTIPIVLFTGGNDEEQVEMAMENGITEVFPKANLDSFEIYLDSFFDDATFELSGKRVLVLEDEKSVGEYLRVVLVEQRLRVDLFDRAAAALDAAFLTTYDLVLTDLILDQNQSGINFIRLLRQSKGKSSAAPVIAMSGHLDDARRIEALRAGADAFLAKPILVSELFFHVQRLIQRIPVPDFINPSAVTLDASLAKTLTEREQLICALVVAGHHDKEIARQLGISYWSVRTRLGRIFQKCGVDNRIELQAKLRESINMSGSPIPVPPAIAAAQAAVQDWFVLASHVLHEIRLGLMVTDKKGVILLVNPGFTDITGYSSEDVIGKTPRLLRSGKQSAAFYRDMLAILEAKGSWSGKLWSRGKAGNLFVEWMDIRRLPPGMPMGAHYVAVIGDVTKQHDEIEHLRRSALHDPLTGLANRALLKDRAAQEIYRAQRNGKRLGVAFIDLDRFKPINDRLGHEVGDKVLQQIARRLSETLRAHDTVARQGGDEFIALLSDIDDRQAVESLARKLLDAFAVPIPIGTDADYPLQASIGISLFPDDGDHFEELVARADVAMYRAKQTGGARACYYDAELDGRAVR